MNVKCEVWNVKWGFAWNVKWGVWNEKCEVWNVKWGIGWNVKCELLSFDEREIICYFSAFLFIIAGHIAARSRLAVT